MKHIYVISLPNSAITKIGVTKSHPKGRLEAISLARDEPARLVAYAIVEPKRAAQLELALKQLFASRRGGRGFEWLNVPADEVARALRAMLQPPEALTVVRYVKRTSLKPRKPNERHSYETIITDPRNAKS